MTSFILSSAITSFISAILSIWTVISLWIIFKKSGRKGWESIIPVRNIYILFKIAGKKGWFWVLFLLPVLWLIVSLLFRVILNSGDISPYSSIYSIKSMINWILGLLVFILPLMAWISLPYGITKKFGKSNWFYLGMLLFTPIFFGILAFGDAKYEGIEYNKKYSWKKWILITLGISLLVGCCSAGIKYYQYKDFYDYLNSFEYDYKVSDENDNIENNITKTDIHEDINEDYVGFKEDILVISGGINNEIGDNTNSEESENLQINSNERNKENTGYIPTNITWIDEIAKNYKGVIIKSSDLIDSSKDGNYRTKPELKKRTLFIDENNGFILKIGPEWIGGFMEIYFNDINEISKIIVSDRDYIRMFDMSIYPHGECDKMDWRYGNEIVWDANDNFVFTKASRYERYMKGVELITHKNNGKTLKEILIENHCVCDGTFGCE